MTCSTFAIGHWLCSFKQSFSKKKNTFTQKLLLVELCYLMLITSYEMYSFYVNDIIDIIGFKQTIYWSPF